MGCGPGEVADGCGECCLCPGAAKLPLGTAVKRNPIPRVASMQLQHAFASPADIFPQAVSFYKNVLFHDASNVEAIACLAAHHFYTDQPEIALRWGRRHRVAQVTWLRLKSGEDTWRS